MFTVSKEEIIEGLRLLRISVCGYANGLHQLHTCDCKYGGPKKPRGEYQGEKTGCPEIATAIAILNAMTKKDYIKLAKKAKLINLSGW